MKCTTNVYSISNEEIKRIIHNEEKDRGRFSESWTYVIVPERLIAYNHGRINEIQVKNIEDSITKIVDSFETMKQDLLFLLKENEE